MKHKLTPLEISRRSEELADLEVQVVKLEEREATPEERSVLLAKLKDILYRVENDLP